MRLAPEVGGKVLRRFLALDCGVRPVCLDGVDDLVVEPSRPVAIEGKPACRAAGQLRGTDLPCRRAERLLVAADGDVPEGLKGARELVDEETGRLDLQGDLLQRGPRSSAEVLQRVECDGPVSVLARCGCRAQCREVVHGVHLLTLCGFSALPTRSDPGRIPLHEAAGLAAAVYP